MHHKASSVDINTKISTKHIKYWRELNRRTDGRTCDLVWLQIFPLIWEEKPWKY